MDTQIIPFHLALAFSASSVEKIDAFNISLRDSTCSNSWRMPRALETSRGTMALARSPSASCFGGICSTRPGLRAGVLKALGWHLGTGDVGRGRNIGPDSRCPAVDVNLASGEGQVISLLAEPLASKPDIVAVPGLTCVARHLRASERLMGGYPKPLSSLRQSVGISVNARFRPKIALRLSELTELLTDNYPEKDSEVRAQLGFAIGELRMMNMQPALERDVRHRGTLRAYGVPRSSSSPVTVARRARCLRRSVSRSEHFPVESREA